MTLNDPVGASQRARRRRRAAAAVACVFLGGASLGAAVGLTYTRAPRRQYEKAFDSIGLTVSQRRATDSIMAHYACAIDSINRAAQPRIDSIRRLARQDVMEVLNESQIAQLNRVLGAGDGKRGPHRLDRRGACDHGVDSMSHPRYLRL
jgi:hypothetical protein